ncbi:NADH dehydrogenase [Cyphellophora attinorum]|uniref:NADH dehydrogenase n=1 Tax=Cyphellophora attinorum TaxID=1664694 RepID=A0A0N0NRD0_9EURO|nr:NADH dehydrogenase [Phialophora attinorum]KPI44689.1 NADH dehydrogenase [Phialophora attinorum]
MSDTGVKNIIIVGGAYSGVSIAHYLLKHVLPKLSNASAYQIILVSTSAQALCRPACPRAMILDDFFDQSKLFVDIDAQFKHYPATNFNFVKGAVVDWNHHEGHITIHSAQGETSVLSYHSLVLASGSSTPSPLLGLNGDELELRSSWTQFRASLKSAKRIVIAGGGPAGVETAGELGEYLNGRLCGWSGSSPKSKKVDIKLVTSASQLLPALRPSIAGKAETYLSALGVEVIKNSKVVHVQPEGAGISSVTTSATIKLDNDQTLEADIYIPATGTKANTSFADPALLAEDGRITTNPSTLRVDLAGVRVYALGDVASAARPAIHVIFEQVPVVCANIKRDLLLAEGQDEKSVGQDRVFREDVRETQMVLIGKNAGLGAAMGWALPSWAVKMIKRDYWLWTTANLWSGKQWEKEK